MRKSLSADKTVCDLRVVFRPTMRAKKYGRRQFICPNPIDLHMQCMYINTNAASCQALFGITSALPFNGLCKDSAPLSSCNESIYTKSCKIKGKCKKSI